jgi:hypothetical protein
MDLPKEGPELVDRADGEIGIARDDRAEMWPRRPFLARAILLWVMEDVERSLFQRIGVPFAFNENVVVRLALKLKSAWSKRGVPGTVEKFLRIELVGVLVDSHPKEVGVVRHEAVGGAVELITGTGVEEKLTHQRVGGAVEPSRGPLVERHDPMHPCLPLVVVSLQPFESRGRSSSQGHEEKLSG